MATATYHLLLTANVKLASTVSIVTKFLNKLCFQVSLPSPPNLLLPLPS